MYRLSCYDILWVVFACADEYAGQGSTTKAADLYHGSEDGVLEGEAGDALCAAVIRREWTGVKQVCGDHGVVR